MCWLLFLEFTVQNEGDPNFISLRIHTIRTIEILRMTNSQCWAIFFLIFQLSQSIISQLLALGPLDEERFHDQLCIYLFSSVVAFLRAYNVYIKLRLRLHISHSTLRAMG